MARTPRRPHILRISTRPSCTNNPSQKRISISTQTDNLDPAARHVGTPPRTTTNLADFTQVNTTRHDRLARSRWPPDIVTCAARAGTATKRSNLHAAVSAWAYWYKTQTLFLALSQPTPPPILHPKHDDIAYGSRHAPKLVGLAFRRDTMLLSSHAARSQSGLGCLE
jgi:hypothetical protein